MSKSFTPEKIFQTGTLLKKNEMAAADREASQRSWVRYFVVLRGQFLIFFKDQKQVRPPASRSPMLVRT